MPGSSSVSFGLGSEDSDTMNVTLAAVIVFLIVAFLAHWLATRYGPLASA